jgi:hypothetical protein
VGALAGAVGGAAGFQLVGLAQPWLGLGHGLAVAAAGPVVAAGLLLLLPETGGRELEP